MPTELPLEVYLFWVAVIVVIIICCVLLFLWGAVAIGEKSEEQMLNVQGSMFNEGKGKSNA